MRIEIESGYIDDLPNMTEEEMKFFIRGQQCGMTITLTLSQLTKLRDYFDILIESFED